MQKIFNAIAVASGVLSLTVVGSGLFVYINKDAIINTIKEKAMESITGNLAVSYTHLTLPTTSPV